MMKPLIGAALAFLIATPIAHAQDYAEVERSSIYVPVRDGTRLAMNIYRPADSDGVEQEKLPVIFAFTPYRARYNGRDGEVVELALGGQLALRSLIRAGYIVAVADIRGKGASFGHRRGFQDRTEAQDGYDLVEWLAAQDFTTDDVGMMGCSYLGGTVMHTATTTPPSLKAAFIGASDWDKYAFVRRGGITAQFNTRPDEPLSDDLASIPVDGDQDGALLRDAVAQHADNTSMSGLWYSMPYRDSVSPLTENAFWDEVAIWQYADTVRNSDIATYLWSNWKDEPTSQSIIAAHNLGSRFLAGPDSHCRPPTGFDFDGEVQRFFDFHLKGIENGFDQQPRATYWVNEGAGQGHYAYEDQLPGSTSQPLSFYLNSEEGAENGLTLSSSPGAAGADDYEVIYDVPEPEYFSFWPSSIAEVGLNYTSAPLERSMDLLGYPVAHLELRADKPDADVFVYLEELRANGEVEVLSFGRLKLSHRAVSPAPWQDFGLPWHSGLEADVTPLADGEVAQMQIAMGPLTHHFDAGSRIRFVVTGADPRQRNLEEVRQDPAPNLEVLRGWGSASRIELPLVAIEGEKVNEAAASPSTEANAPIDGQIGEPAGTGLHPAIAQSREDAAGYTIYRPSVLPDEPMPLVLWGNGACIDNGLSASHILREIASHGYMVIANGSPKAERPARDEIGPPLVMPASTSTPPNRGVDETSIDQYLAAIDWAGRANADPKDSLYRRIDTSRIAALGHSCGGLQALAAARDPRVDTAIALGSGVYVRPDTGLSGVHMTKDRLKDIQGPILYILGGESDIAFPNGTDDFEQIDHVPVYLASLPVGHGGTLSLRNGGDWASVSVDWLNWQLKDDQLASRQFNGEDCGLCTRYGWTFQSKPVPSDPQ